MKKIGLLLLISGIVLGLLYPWAKINFLGKEITEVQLANLHFNAKQTATMQLKVEHNLVRARFLAKFKPATNFPASTIPMFVRIDGPGNLSIGTKIKFPANARATEPEAGKITSGTSVDFNVKQDGLHRISLELAPNITTGVSQRPDIETVTVSFIANAADKDNPFQIWSIMFALLGVYLMLRGRRENKSIKLGRWGRN